MRRITQVAALPATDLRCQAGIQTRIFLATSAVAAHPAVAVEVGTGYKVIGGGAFANWRGAGSLLIASYPEAPRKWVAAAKDHRYADPASITAWAIGLHDPRDEWEVVCVAHSGEEAGDAQASVALPEGYSLTGGGARVDFSGAGSLLTASYPYDSASWRAEAKEHSYACPARVTAYALGIRPRHTQPLPSSIIALATSDVAPHPQAAARLRPGYVLTGGGARANWSGAGSLLTASFPSGKASWEGRAKDHLVSAPASLTVFAIGYPELSSGTAERKARPPAA